MSDIDPNSYPVGTASVSWVDSANVTQIRVYSTDGYNIIERVWDAQASWYTSEFSAQGSQVSATVHEYEDQFYVRVYCTGGNKTVEMCQDAGGDWYVGAYTTQ